ncbi:MAG: DUF1294 domain-containing protein [Desulfotomaculaceae bacterium]|nr:DUF1294 domain-containing protein [Desulfotomaculaceae bacterium]
MEIYNVLLILINLCGVVIMGYDKFLSKHPGARRVPEKNLFLNALVGGAIGVYLGMYIFRHKTKHWLFKIGIPIIILVQVVLYLIVFYKGAIATR